MTINRSFNSAYADEYLSRVAFPIGGIGAGMFCIEGTGAISHMSIMNEPDMFSEPSMMGAVCVKGHSDGARILEGQIPKWRYFGRSGAALGGGTKYSTWGLPRYARAEFDARFPFGTVSLSDPGMPLDVEIEGFSPFIPGNADDSSLPVGSLTYRFLNTGNEPLEAVFSYHAFNFLPGPPPPGQAAPGTRRVETVAGGFVLQSKPADQLHLHSAFAIACDHPDTSVDAQLFRGGWYDSVSMVWAAIRDGAVISNPAHSPDEAVASPGGSLFVPFEIEAAGSYEITIRMAWYSPFSTVREGHPVDEQCEGGCECKPPAVENRHRPWYASRFEGIKDVLSYWNDQWSRLREESAKFRDCFYDSTLPPEVIEAVAANLTILKSPTCLRLPDGKFWAWEGCRDTAGCCAGSCTHVWNYAQALPHLFPDLERSMREIEFGENQWAKGYQRFRASLPLAPASESGEERAAADGQLGGIMKIYRDYRISGDADWLAKMWPAARKSLDYCIEIWDPDRIGAVVEPHHNTYDIEFWGPNGMCTSFYCGALAAAAEMARLLDDQEALGIYSALYEKSRAYLQNELFDGEYFIQKIRWKDLKAPDPSELQSWSVNYSDEAKVLLDKEGPKYQYGRGCLSDGILGAWIAEMSGLSDVVDPAKVRSHLLAVYRHNLLRDLSLHANPQRPTFALGDDGGLLLCSWPKGGQPALPFVYSNEVWTGIEYQVASHLIIMGEVEAGLDIVRTARKRYDGRVRNPFDEYECGHWYARAMASYGMLQALTGIRYDAVEKILYIKPKIEGDFRSFISTASGYGTAGIRNGEGFLEVVSGSIEPETIVVDI